MYRSRGSWVLILALCLAQPAAAGPLTSFLRVENADSGKQLVGCVDLPIPTRDGDSAGFFPVKSAGYPMMTSTDGSSTIVTHHPVTVRLDAECAPVPLYAAAFIGTPIDASIHLFGENIAGTAIVNVLTITLEDARIQSMTVAGAATDPHTAPGASTDLLVSFRFYRITISDHERLLEAQSTNRNP